MMSLEEMKRTAREEVLEKRENPCIAEWGHCTQAPPSLNGSIASFGKPSATPHQCKGERGHRSKIHRCETCGAFGAVHMPLKGTRAGRELQALIDAVRDLEKDAKAEATA